MKRFKDRKIASKLIILFAAVSVALVLFLGYQIIRISTQDLIFQIEKSCKIEASGILTAIDIIMDENFNQIRRFADDAAFTGGESTPEEMTAFLKEKKKIYDYASLSYFDMNRIRIADSEGRHLGEKSDLIGYWNDVLNGKISSGSDVRISDDLKKPVIFFASPVKNNNGRAIGVIAAAVDFKDIAFAVKGSGIKNKCVALINKERDILFSNCEILEKLILKEKITEMPSVESVLSGQDGVISEYSPYHKNDLFTAYIHEVGWQNFKGNNWFLIISSEKEKILEPIRTLRNTIFGAVVLTLFIILIVTFFIARFITKPIVGLNKTAQKMKTGDLTQKAEVNSADEAGQLAIVFNQMVDSLKESYDKLAVYNIGMGKKAIERTKELSESQEAIVRSERLAVLGQFASGIAHELKKPLGIMKNTVNHISVLELDKVNPKIKEDIDTLSKEIEYSNNIITDLLEFSRIKKPVLRLENINMLIKETLSRLKIPPNIEIVTELAYDLPAIEVDAPQIQQVFYNILCNALQAMVKGGKLTVLSSVSVYVMVSFQDTGTGISKEELGKIFQPLYTTRPDGTGLGLSICASIIEGHSGKLEVKSEVGVGTKFTVKLPVERV